MEHFIIITVIFCLASSIFFSPCDSLLGTVAGSDYDHHLSHPAVKPRKLRPSKDHQISRKNDHYGGPQDFATHDAKHDAFVAGKADKNEAKKMQSSVETWREWVEAEGSDTSQYFTMDYSRVRRRRPIHNKALPVAP
ncbi:hypothetical protein POM88_027781 [Heracleum sosnowskyi]|uniref:Uncharacterized protein n=1 Tax=Heracleum sosnowskyi TaxID=360622 RepID=A0AAD8I887_9APIA|nr:hypothetical protein POM88_027781 [Heracleum sosnowskyi]